MSTRDLRAGRGSSSSFVWSCRGLRRRQLHVELRAATAVGLDPDPAVHPVHELAADVEAEARAADAERQVRVEPEELLEDPVPLAGGHAEAFVRDAEADRVARM